MKKALLILIFVTTKCAAFSQCDTTIARDGNKMHFSYSCGSLDLDSSSIKEILNCIECEEIKKSDRRNFYTDSLSFYYENGNLKETTFGGTTRVKGSNSLGSFI